MRTIAVVNQKGGCGKTTVSINLASALASLDKKVLLVDMDPQSHCAVGLAVPEEQIEQSIYDVLISESRSEPMRLTEILWQIGERTEAERMFERLLGYANHLGLFSEDLDFKTKELLGNFPQGYSHLAVIDCAILLGGMRGAGSSA